MSHEFRTPLHGILGMTQLLLGTKLDPEQATYVTAVQSSAEAFLRLVDEILDFSRVEADGIALADEPFDLPSLVGGVVELLAPRAQGKGIEIASFVDRKAPRLVRGDAGRLRQVLLNLAGNAVKFTASGGVGVALETAGAGEVTISVSDTGPGIAPEFCEAIFDAYQQGGLPGESSVGTGLGLAITRGLVERMGGAITVESEVGVGSRFTVRLPLPAADGPEAASPRSALPGAVLLLSSSPFEGPFIARTLEQAGASTVAVASLDEALAAMARERFDAVVADAASAGADLRVVAAEARRLGVRRSLVLLSPFERRDLGSPHAAGFDAFLIKPVRPRSLFEQLAGRHVAAAGATSFPERRTVAPAAGGALRVLLAEDNDINALVAMKALERLGALVDWARDGRDALARAEAALADGTPFDIVLTDLRMPGLDGIETARRIRDRERALGAARSRMIALSASLRAGSDRVSEDFDGSLTKPFGFDDLAKAIWGEPPGAAAAG